jgi:alcohol dehydrogenase class IV
MWYFYSPTVVFGEGALDHLENIDGTKCFIVTDPIMEKLGLLDILTKTLEGANKEWQAFTEVEPEPAEETIYRAAEQCKSFEPDLVIGIGGGSCLDAAKAVWVLYEHPDFETIDEIHPFQKLHTGCKAKMVAIPTTSGTGSETTWAVIISRNQGGVHAKLEQVNKAVIPTYALVDPVFPSKMPPALTAATGFDALAHSIEGLVATWQNVFSDALAIHAVRLIFQYLPRAVKNGEDTTAREQMHNAATMAGLAFGNSQVIIGHGMAHAIGAVLHIPHGNAVGMCLPYTMEYCINDLDSDTGVKKFALMAKSVGAASWSDDDKKAAKALVEKIKKLQDQVNLPGSLKDLGISEEDFAAVRGVIVEQCLESPSVTMTPRNIGAGTFEKMLDYMYDGKSIDF